MFLKDKHKQGIRGLRALNWVVSQGCLGALGPVHRLLLPSWEPNAEGTFTAGWSL